MKSLQMTCPGKQTDWLKRIPGWNREVTCLSMSHIGCWPEHRLHNRVSDIFFFSRCIVHAVLCATISNTHITLQLRIHPEAYVLHPVFLFRFNPVIDTITDVFIRLRLYCNNLHLYNPSFRENKAILWNQWSDSSTRSTPLVTHFTHIFTWWCSYSTWTIIDEGLVKKKPIK